MLKPVAITPRCAPATTNDARLGTAEGVALRIAELEAQAEYYASSQPAEARRLRREADALRTGTHTHR